MANILTVKTFANRRLQPEDAVQWGKVSIIEANKDIPFDIKRVFYIYGTDPHVFRGGHRLKDTQQALIVVAGSYDIYINNGHDQQHVVLDSPDKCLILEPADWHTMEALTPDSILLVISSAYYDTNKYIDEPYPDTPAEIVKAVAHA